jgi:hypothetical protein
MLVHLFNHLSWSPREYRLSAADAQLIDAAPPAGLA